MKLNIVYYVSIFVSVISVILYILIKNSFLCSSFYFKENVLPVLCRNLSKVSSLSVISDDLYFQDFCSYLCSTPLEYTCHTYHLSKPFVFTVYEKDKDQKFVLKAVIEDNQDEEAYWKQTSEDPYIPTTEELQNMVAAHVNVFLGTSAYNSLNQINSSLYLSESVDLSLHEEFWKLIYDHEFLTAYLFKYFNIFPAIRGTCKSFYAVEFAQPLIENPLLSLDITWKARIGKAIELLYFIEKLTAVWYEPIHLCDAKHDHFGWYKGEVLYLDLDCVVTESALKNIMNNFPECSSNEDCSYFDCLGECLPNKQCSDSRRNTNLQVLCHKIFLGYSDSSIMGLYGLLNDHEGSDSLKEAIDLCSVNPGMTIEVLLRILETEYLSIPSTEH